MGSIWDKGGIFFVNKMTVASPISVSSLIIKEGRVPLQRMEGDGVNEILHVDEAEEDWSFEDEIVVFITGTSSASCLGTGLEPSCWTGLAAVPFL